MRSTKKMENILITFMFLMALIAIGISMHTKKAVENINYKLNRIEQISSSNAATLEYFGTYRGLIINNEHGESEIIFVQVEGTNDTLREENLEYKKRKIEAIQPFQVQ